MTTYRVETRVDGTGEWKVAMEVEADDYRDVWESITPEIFGAWGADAMKGLGYMCFKDEYWPEASPIRFIGSNGYSHYFMSCTQDAGFGQAQVIYKVLRDRTEITGRTFFI